MERTERHHDSTSRPADVRLRRDIAAAVTLKIAALALLYALFFAPAQRVVVDAGRMQALLTAGGGAER